MSYYINISNKDWFLVFSFGLVFGGFLGVFISLLSGLTSSLIDGFLTGVLFGFFIFTFSYLLINFSNSYLLKILPEKIWIPFSLFVSFIAGIIGSLLSYTVIKYLNLIDLNLSYSTVITGSLIVGSLTALIGYLLYKIVSLRKKESDLEKSIIETKLKALEYQINPHYLFNSLNVIAELIHIDKEKAEEALIKLSKFLRDIIEEDSWITLEKEIEIVKNFLFIQTMRFPGISIHMDIDKKTLHYLVPKLSLQILVENAIKHGVKSKGNIWINVRKSNNSLVVEVIDDGRDFNGIKEGIGLRNLKNRLSIFGGNLSYFRDDEKTIFIFNIPINIGNMI
ncbi:MAG: histidine kinase [Hydrogenothermaceae bacterium]|nr:histidine kinase [Hydrogenothermaceae bacterium]